MNVPNVKLHFQTSGAATEAILAPNQHVYIDIDPKAPGVLQHLRSDSTGTIITDGSSPVGASSKPGPKISSLVVTLDDARAYSVVVSANPLGAVPSVGVSAKVSAGRLVVPAHIAVQVTSDGTKGVGGLACELTIGSNTTMVKTTSTGWIASSDRTAGAVTLSVAGKVLLLPGGSAPKPSLTVAPAKPVRGDKTKITVTTPTGAVAFKVAGWTYDISHQNPGSSAPSTAKVTRPASENSTTFGSFWEGLLCASGTVKALYALGVALRGSGDKSVSAVVVVQDAAEASLAITVAPRTGGSWESGLVEKPEQPLTKPIATFHDTGHHQWDPSALKVDPTTISDGPNRGCAFVKTASITFTSTPSINSLLSDASSAFSQAQDKAYLTSPRPIRVIPQRLYTSGAGGAITITNNDDFAEWILGRPLKPGESLNWMTSAHCIGQSQLLAGTQRHEYKDPDKSHKQNCLKARRALDPVKFGEALVQLPGASINFLNTINARATAVTNAAPTHDVVDEDETRKAGALKFKSGLKILGVNSDASGNVIGPVWNPARNAELTN